MRHIQHNRWNVGDRLPSEDQLLAEFGVSRSTIREALNTLAAQGTIIRRHGVGTFVARVPEIGDIIVFAWLHALTSGTGDFFHDLIVGVKTRIEEAGYSAVLSVGHGDTRDEISQSVQRFLERPSAQETAGVLSLLPVENVENIVQKADVPMVMMGTLVPFGRHSIILDHVSMLNQGADLLASHGHDEFALMYIEPAVAPFSSRFIDEVHRSVKVISEERTCTLIPVQETESYGIGAYKAFMDWWAKPNRPNAIMFTDDYLTEVACQAIRELGIRVPEDVDIVYGTSNTRGFPSPAPLSRVQFSADEVAAAAWEMLNTLISDNEVDDSIVYVKPTVVEAASVGQAPPTALQRAVQ